MKFKPYITSLLVFLAFGSICLTVSLMNTQILSKVIIIAVIAILMSFITVVNIHGSIPSSVDNKDKESYEAEIARLKGMRIDVNTVKPVLKLSLLEYDGNITDCKLDPFNEEKGIIFRDEVHEYLGVAQIEVKAHLGVDLNKIRISNADSNTIIVSGIKSEFQGITKFDPIWMIREIRIDKKESKTLPRSHFIDHKCAGETLAKYSDEQIKEIRTRIEQGINLPALDKAVTEWARNFLIVLLSPLNKRIHFQASEDIQGLLFLEFIRQHNQQIDSRIKELKP